MNTARSQPPHSQEQPAVVAVVAFVLALIGLILYLVKGGAELDNHWLWFYSAFVAFLFSRIWDRAINRREP